MVEPQSEEKKETSRNIVGVYPISIHNLHEAIDGGACKFEKKFIKSGYGAHGYYVPGGPFLSFESYVGSH